jgi:hypothetical protein
MDRRRGGELRQFAAHIASATRHPNPFFSQRPGHRQSDAPAGAGDEGHLARQLKIH